MGTVVSLFVNVFAAMAAIPFLSFALVYIITLRLTQQKKRAMHWSMDVTTVLLIMAVGALWQYIWGSSVGWWVLLGLLLLLYVTLALLQIWLKGKLDWERLGRGGWRLSFILFSTLYLIFFVIGMQTG